MSDQEKEEGLTTGGLKTGGLKTGSLSDRPENSNIKQAAPMSGLQTGSVKDHIASQYEPALSGSEGPRARFDTLRELINTEIESYESGKVVSSPGSDSLTGFGQFKTLRISRRSSGQAAAIPEERVPYRPGFWVYPSGENKVTVHPSVVSGMSAASEIPDGVGEPISVSGVGRVIALRVEAEPTVNNIGTIEDQNYVIVDGGGVIQGSIEVVTFSSISSMNDASAVALIDNSDGTVTQNGIYHLPLAMTVEGGGLLQVGHIGPIGIRMCAAGSLVVNSPTLQIITLDANYNIVDPYSE